MTKRISVEQMPEVENDEQMRHLVRYVNFINSRPERDLIKNGKYFNVHHIVPKSLNGKNSKSNLIKLTHREHYIAHLILWKCGYREMASSFHFMVHNNRFDNRITSKSYEILKVDYSNSLTFKFSGENNPMFGKNAYEFKTEEEMKIIREKISCALTNRTPQQKKETRKKISQSLKGRKHTEEHNKKVSIAKTGNLRSEESKKKQSNSVMGIKNPFYGKHHSEENKLKIGVNKKTIYVNKNNKNKRIKEKDVETYLENGYNIGMYRKNAKGRIWVNNGVESKMIFPNELNFYVENNFIIGRIKN
jgi:hypothetical protein